jgi:type I restriction enzyme, S subunit
VSTDLLLRELERLAGHPHSVQRLRRVILDLAIRGKLVEQRSNEEPASGLLIRVAAKKAELARTARIGRRSQAPSSPNELARFPVPRNWAWTCLAEIGFLSPRCKAPDDLEASFVPMSLISPEYGVPNDHEVRVWSAIKKGYTQFAEGDVGVAKITPCFENGKSTVFRGLTGGIGAGTTELHIVRPVLVNADYLLIFLKSHSFIDAGIPRMTGTAGQKRIPANYFASAPLPLPPLEEQGRIVAKVDELMALCDQLTAAQKECASRRDALRRASLQRLTAADRNEVTDKADVRFFLRTSPRFITTPEHVATVRQTILDLAVRGRLAPQDPADEHASELFRQISMDRDLATSSGRLKPITHIPGSATTDWAVPRSWLIVPLPAVIYFQEGPGLRNWQFRPSGIPFLNIRTLQDGKVIRERCQFLDPTEVANKYRHFLVRKGDILCSTSGTIGKVAVAEEDDLPLMLNTSIVRFAPYGESGPAPGFIKLFLGTQYFLDQAHRSTTGSAQVNMGPSHLKLMAFPLPPLAEQHRIIAKVDELATLCDELETALASSEAQRARLLESLLHEALDERAEHLVAANAVAGGAS